MPIIQAARRAGVAAPLFFLFFFYLQLKASYTRDIGAAEEEEARVVPSIQAAWRAGVTAPIIYLFIYY